MEIIKKIITNAGVATQDAHVSVSLVLAKYPEAELVYGIPTQEDLNDPSTCVIDVGGIHDPERSCFDHHQNKNLPCSFILILRHLKLEWLKDHVMWIKAMDVQDREGDKGLSLYLDVEIGITKELSPPYSECSRQWCRDNVELGRSLLIYTGAVLWNDIALLQEARDFWFHEADRPVLWNGLTVLDARHLTADDLSKYIKNIPRGIYMPDITITTDASYDPPKTTICASVRRLSLIKFSLEDVNPEQFEFVDTKGRFVVLKENDTRPALELLDSLGVKPEKPNPSSRYRNNWLHSKDG